MTTTITGDKSTGLIFESYTAPVAGELVTGGSIQTVTQGLANDVANLHDFVVPVGGVQVTRQFRCGPMFIKNTTDWDFDISNVGVWTDLQSPPSQNPLHWPLDVPDRAVLAALVATIKGNTGHGALPANMPQIELFEVLVSTGARTSLGSQADTTGTVTPYQAVHSFPTALTITGSNTAWASATAYTVGDYRKQGGNLYICTHAGTSNATVPLSGTGPSILDGDAVWCYAGPDTGYVVDRRLKSYYIVYSGEGGANAVIQSQLVALRATYTEYLPAHAGR